MENSFSLGYRFLNSVGNIGFSSAYDPATGTFELQNVYPAEYVVQAVIPAPGPPANAAGDQAALASSRAAQATRPGGSTPIRVVDADVNNVRPPDLSP